jgi:hypothetical protein
MRPVSVEKLWDLMRQALELGKCQKGADVLGVFQVLAAWEPLLPADAESKGSRDKGNKAGKGQVSKFASGLSEFAMEGLCEYVQGLEAEAQLRVVLRELDSAAGLNAYT